MSYWSKQVIAREVELEKMRRAKPKVTGEVHKEIQQHEVAPSTTALPNHLQRLIAKSIKTTKPAQMVNFYSLILSKMNNFSLFYNFLLQVSKDFFGRVSTKSVTSSQNEGKFTLDLHNK